MKTFCAIWTKPEQTFGYLESQKDRNLKLKLDVLFFLGTLAFAMPKIISDYHSADGHIVFYLIGIPVIYGFTGLLTFKYFVVWMFHTTGKIFQGKASKSQIRLVLAYSMIPGLVNFGMIIVLAVIVLIIRNIGMVAYQNGLAQFIIWLFGIRTLIIGLAKFNGYSYGYSILNIIFVTSVFEIISYLLKQMMQ